MKTLRQICSVLMLVLALATTAWATDITVSSFMVTNHQATTAQVRIYYSDTFVDSTGQTVVGGAINSNSYYKRVPCTVNTTTKVATCESFTLASTTDSSRPQARVSLVMYDAANRFLANLHTNLIIPTHLSPVSVQQLVAYTSGQPRPLGDAYLNREQTIALIGSATSVPDATTTVKGKVLLAEDGEATALEAVQGSDARIPTQNENNALVGTSGSPGSANKFVTDADPRLDPATVSGPGLMPTLSGDPSKCFVGDGSQIPCPGGGAPGSGLTAVNGQTGPAVSIGNSTNITVTAADNVITPTLVGPIADALLTSNVPLKNAANTFTATNTFAPATGDVAFKTQDNVGQAITHRLPSSLVNYDLYWPTRATLGTLNLLRAIVPVLGTTTLSFSSTPWSVPEGGMGKVTLGVNSLLVGNGTSAVGEISPGAAGRFLGSDGTTWAARLLTLSGIDSSILSGSGSKLLTLSGSVVNGQCAYGDAVGNIVFAACPSGGGGGGLINSVSNAGTAGVGVFKQLLGTDAQLKNINAASSRITVTNNATLNTIDIDVPSATTVQKGTVELSVTGTDIAVGTTDLRIPTQNENDALTGGTYGVFTTAPSSANRYVTENDPRIGAEYIVAGYSSFVSAVSGIGASSATLVVNVPSTISSDVTIPSSLKLRRAGSGRLLISSGVTLTVADGNSLSSIGPEQIFDLDGTGTVRFTKAPLVIHPEWWGASADDAGPDSPHSGGATDNLAAFNAMMDSVAAANVAFIFKSAKIELSKTGVYYLSDTFHIKTAVDIGCEGGFGWSPCAWMRWPGNKTKIITHALSTFTGTTAGGDDARWTRLHGFGIIGDSTASATTHTVNISGLTLTKTAGSSFADNLGYHDHNTITVNGFTYPMNAFVSTTQVTIRPPRIHVTLTNSSTTISEATGAAPFPTVSTDWAGSTFVASGATYTISSVTSSAGGPFSSGTATISPAFSGATGPQTVALSGASITAGAARPNLYHGIDVRGTTHIEGMYIKWNDGNGISMDSSVGTSSYPGVLPNTNYSRIIGNYVYTNRGNGFYARGVNSNQIYISNNDFTANHGAGIAEFSFLGNNYFGDHVSGNARGAVVGVTGGVNVSNFYSTYTEGGQASELYGQNMIVLGGNHGAGISMSESDVDFKRIIGGSAATGTGTRDAFLFAGGDVATGNIGGPIRTVTGASNYLMTFADQHLVVTGTGTASYPAASASTGRDFTVTASSGTVTLFATGGALEVSTLSIGQTVTMFSNGTDWKVRNNKFGSLGASGNVALGDGSGASNAQEIKFFSGVPTANSGPVGTLKFSGAVGSGQANSAIGSVQGYMGYATNTNALLFSVGAWNNNDTLPTPAMVIISGGNVGIGDTTPATPLEVNGIIRGTIQDRGGKEFNCKAYGATGDGVTDESTALNACITAAGATGDAHIPAGTYILNAELTMTANYARIKGAGIGKTVLKRKVGAGAISMIQVNGANSSISGLTVNGNFTAGAGAGIDISISAANAQVYDFEAIDSPYISVATGADGTTVRDCYLTGVGSATVGAAFGVWTDSTFGGSNLTVKGCTIKDYRLNGIFVGATYLAVTNATNANPIVLTHSASPDQWITGSQVTVQGVKGNTTANGRWTYTRISATSGSINAIGNGAYTSGGAVGLTRGDRNLITDNIFDFNNRGPCDPDCGGAGQVDLQQFTIFTNNRVTNTGPYSYGIESQGGGIFTNNRIESSAGSTRHAIEIQSSHHYEISGNYGAGFSSGVLFDETFRPTDYIKIHDNNFSNCTTYYSGSTSSGTHNYVISPISEVLKGTDVASAGTITATGATFTVTGTATISTIGTTDITVGTVIHMITSAAAVFDEAGNIDVTGATSLTSAAGNLVIAVWDSVKWRLR